MDKTKWSSFGAVGSAVLASSCCIGPLILTLLGIGSFSAAASLERYRPIFMALTVLILGGAWYLTYRKRTSDCADGSCQRKGASRWSKLSLWAATGMAIVLMFFPQWSTLLVGATQITGPEEEVVVLDVSGMTCGGCALTIQQALASVPGVGAAAVDFETSTATVQLVGAENSVDELIAAVRKSGYDAKPATGGQTDREPPPSETQEER